MIIQVNIDKVQKAIQLWGEKELQVDIPSESKSEHLQKLHGQLAKLRHSVISVYLEQKEIDMLEDYL